MNQLAIEESFGEPTFNNTASIGNGVFYAVQAGIM
jgi:hypothetical protein